MSKITAIILTRNEENMIADCIESVSFCDEIIVIDSHSSDRTAEIAKLMGAKIYQTDASDFAERRNIGLMKAKTTWVLYVDADERASDSLRENIKYQISNVKSPVAAYRIKRKNFYLGNHEWPTIEKLERLFKKKSLKGWKGKLHESAQTEGEIGELDGYLMHYTHRDLTSMLNKTILWSAVEAELRFKANHPPVTWWRIPRVMLTAFYDSYIRQQGFKAGTVGVLESIYQAFSMFITYARLWEIQQKKG